VLWYYNKQMKFNHHIFVDPLWT